MSKEERDDKLYLVNAAGERIHEMPVLKGSIGPDVLDIRRLYQDTGYFTYDPGFTSTASCASNLTYIDGDAGVLLHGGYSIQDLAEHSSFLEVAYMLLHGGLPDKKELEEFKYIVSRHTMVNDQVTDFFRGFGRNAHPMAILMGVVGGLSAFYHDSLDVENPRHREISTFRMLAKMPTIAAMAFKYTKGEPFVYPDNSLDYVSNFLSMSFAMPTEKFHVVKEVRDALEKIFVLHADHEQNASTSTVRSAGSSGANPFACIAAGISSLWGPAHGGANEAVIKMLDEIGSPDRIPEYIEKAKDKNDPFRLMGFGHRVYKNYDPRAGVLKNSCDEVLSALGKENEDLFILAQQLEKIALEDDYFVERKLFPNVDFYSGIILKAMGFPTSMFTVLFAVARTAGWLAQWNEMMQDKSQKIARPRQLYTGAKKKAYQDSESKS